MLNINTELRQAYYALLNGNVLLNSTAVPVYFGQAPMGMQPDTYILIQGISSTNFNADCNSFTDTNIVIYIVTKRFQNNSGLDAEDIAGQIFSLVYPSPTDQLVQITNGNVINTKLANDIEITGLTDGQKQIINRVITFDHTISH